MNVLVFFDVETVRINKTVNFLRKYLHRSEGSVFKGKLTKAELEEVKKGLKNIFKKKDGGLILYRAIGQYEDRVMTISKIKNKDNCIIESEIIDLGKIASPLIVQLLGKWHEKDFLANVIRFLTWKFFFRSLGLK